MKRVIERVEESVRKRAKIAECRNQIERDRDQAALEWVAKLGIESGPEWTLLGDTWILVKEEKAYAVLSPCCCKDGDLERMDIPSFSCDPELFSSVFLLIRHQLTFRDWISFCLVCKTTVPHLRNGALRGASLVVEVIQSCLGVGTYYGRFLDVSDSSAILKKLVLGFDTTIETGKITSSNTQKFYFDGFGNRNVLEHEKFRLASTIIAILMRTDERRAKSVPLPEAQVTFGKAQPRIRWNRDTIRVLKAGIEFTIPSRGMLSFQNRLNRVTITPSDVRKIMNIFITLVFLHPDAKTTKQLVPLMTLAKQGIESIPGENKSLG